MQHYDKGNVYFPQIKTVAHPYRKLTLCAMPLFCSGGGAPL
jgi:hypothetical protein